MDLSILSDTTTPTRELRGGLLMSMSSSPSPCSVSVGGGVVVEEGSAAAVEKECDCDDEDEDGACTPPALGLHEGKRSCCCCRWCTRREGED